MRARAWIEASHAGPTAVMTIAITGLCFAGGWRGVPLALAALAALAGQLSVGWCNDAHDAALDAGAGRREKPVVRGDVAARPLMRGAVGMLLASAVLSWAAGGWAAGTFHVAAVLSAWAYDLRLSRTVLSWLPYAVSFACLAPFATIGGLGMPPAAWFVAVLALVGTSAHAANALPDLARDRAAGVGGLATSIGAGPTLVIAVAGLVAASSVLAWALLAASLGAWAAVVAAITAVAVIAALAARERAFALVMAAGLADLVVVVASAIPLA